MLLKDGLSERVAIYVPQVGDDAINDMRTEEVISFMSLIFGGATVVSALGSWISAGGFMVYDDIKIVYSNTTEAVLKSNIQYVIEYCRELQQTLDQEAITLEINGVIHFITMEEKVNA